ncbi:hypothetical protein FQA39_LY07620 [Lamprigera yunnana]|nr:hypothetical protein FQA39_LY07620 [Lamprigera yunnana]
MNVSNGTNTQEKRIDVNVSGVILTPLMCSTIINEIIKCLLYEKSQIPYPYNWLKSMVNRKRGRENVEIKSTNYLVERHYRTVSVAYDSLEIVMNNINAEFKTDGSNINRVLILFGSTLYSATEMYTIEVLNLITGHLEENHVQSNSRNQHKVLRNIMFSEEWLQAMNRTIPPTNMYILIEKYGSKMYEEKPELEFHLTKRYTICSRVKNVSIILQCDRNVKYNCCNSLLIFEDKNSREGNCSKSNQDDECTISNFNNDETLWFQSKTFIKGFKECFIKGVSASELW